MCLPCTIVPYTASLGFASQIEFHLVSAGLDIAIVSQSKNDAVLLRKIIVNDGQVKNLLVLSFDESEKLCYIKVVFYEGLINWIFGKKQSRKLAIWIEQILRKAPKSDLSPRIDWIKND